MNVLTQNQIDEILKIINFHHINFISEQVGSQVLTSSDIELLKEFGIDVDLLSKTGVIDNAFKFGILSTALSDEKLQQLSYEHFRDFLKQGAGIPLSKEEKFALNNIKHRAYSDIKGLGNKVQRDFQTILIEQSYLQRKKYEKIIQDTAAKNIVTRGSIRSMVSEIGHKTGDWSRDLVRISDFILHDAFDNGRAENIKSKFGDQAAVYKEVYPGACKHCIRLYLTDGIGSEPIIYPVIELIQNGTNIGVSPPDWKPVIGCTHPFCRCTIRRKPEGYKWDIEKRSFSIATGERKVQRKSKIKVKLGDKEFEV